MMGVTWCLAPQEHPDEHMRAHPYFSKEKKERGYRAKRHGAAKAKLIGPVTRP